MGKAMTDKLIELTMNINRLDRDCNNKLIAKIKKTFLIWKAKRSMLRDIRSNGFIMPKDIIDFSILNDTAKVLGLQMDMENVSIRTGDNIQDNVDQLAILKADVKFDKKRRMTITAKAHYEKGSKGEIDMSWHIYEIPSDTNNRRLRSESYSKSVKALFNVYDHSPVNTYSNILAGKSYGIIYNIFVIGIEELFMSIKEKYL